MDKSSGSHASRKAPDHPKKPYACFPLSLARVRCLAKEDPRQDLLLRQVGAS